jgi:uncharacterized protein YcgI (DUF1989 family)
VTKQLDLTVKHPRYALDKDFYDKVRIGRSGHRLVEQFVIPPYNGRGVRVRKGHTVRIIQESGPQIGDVGFWNADNHRESFAAMRTWLVEGWIIRVNTRLWSDLPWFRPMVTCTADTVVTDPGTEFHHHFMGVHCSPEAAEMRFGIAGLNACLLNLLQAIEPFGVKEENLRENINVHEKNRSDPMTGKRTITRGDGKPGDYIEFFAEMDLIVGVSVCPFGDGTGNPTRSGRSLVHPLRVQVYDTGIVPKAFPAWTDWRGRR